MLTLCFSFHQKLNYLTWWQHNVLSWCIYFFLRKYTNYSTPFMYKVEKSKIILWLRGIIVLCVHKTREFLQMWPLWLFCIGSVIIWIRKVRCQHKCNLVLLRKPFCRTSCFSFCLYKWWRCFSINQVIMTNVLA